MTRSLFLCIGVIAISAGVLNADVILIDYDDGAPGGGHDVEVLSGGFTGLTDAAYSPWVSLGTGNPQFRTNFPSPNGGGENYVSTLDRVLAINTGYSIAGGDSYNIEFSWRDAANWDADDTVFMTMFYTADDVIGSTAIDIGALDSGGRVTVADWENESGTVALTDVGAIGHTLFVRINANSAQGEFSRIDNIFVESVSAIPEPGSISVFGMAIIGTVLRRQCQRGKHS
jgi:hypothetical protein